MTFDPESHISIVSEQKLMPVHQFEMLEEKDVDKFDLVSLLINRKDFEAFGLYILDQTILKYENSQGVHFIIYHNFETGFRFKHDLAALCPDSSLK